jgi:hypothetical protein
VSDFDRRPRHGGNAGSYDIAFEDELEVFPDHAKPPAAVCLKIWQVCRVNATPKGPDWETLTPFVPAV